MLVLRADAALRGVSGVEVTVELACGSMSDMAIFQQLSAGNTFPCTVLLFKFQFSC